VICGFWGVYTNALSFPSFSKWRKIAPTFRNKFFFCVNYFFFMWSFNA
jgi:hypothetical protein